MKPGNMPSLQLVMSLHTVDGSPLTMHSLANDKKPTIEKDCAFLLLGELINSELFMNMFSLFPSIVYIYYRCC